MQPDAASARSNAADHDYSSRSAARLPLRNCARSRHNHTQLATHAQAPSALCSVFIHAPSSHDLRMTKRKLHHARFVYPDVCTYPGTHVYHAGNMCLYNADHARRMPNLGLSEELGCGRGALPRRGTCPGTAGRPHVGRDAEGGLKLERSGTAMVSPVRSHTSDTTVGVDTAHDHRTHTGELGSGS
jgi:hypothetical protein